MRVMSARYKGAKSSLSIHDCMLTQDSRGERTRRKFGILAAALATMAISPVSAQSGAADCSATEIGRIKNTTAGVVVIREGRRYRAVAGTRLRECDTIETSRSGRVGITFTDNTRMAIGPNSEVVLKEYRYDRSRGRGRATTEVRRGRVGIDSGNITRSGRDRMRVRTPTSTLGVRGTTFVVEVEG